MDDILDRASLALMQQFPLETASRYDARARTSDHVLLKGSEHPLPPKNPPRGLYQREPLALIQNKDKADVSLNTYCQTHRLALTLPHCLTQKPLAEKKRALQLTAETLRVMSALQSAGIDALPLKGAVLSQYLFGDPACRQSSDVDVLIRPCDFEPAAICLEKLGYDVPRDAFQPHDNEVPCWNHARNTLVDLHYRLHFTCGYFDASFDTLFSRAVTIELADHTLLTLHPIDQLLYLCMHASKHGFERMLWLWDIELAFRKGVGTNTLLTTARAYNALNPLLEAWALCHRLFHRAIPPGVDADMRQYRQLDSQVIYALNRLCMIERANKSGPDIALLRYMLNATSTWRGKCQVLLFILHPTQREKGWVALPRGLRWGYWLLRFGRLCSRVG